MGTIECLKSMQRKKGKNGVESEEEFGRWVKDRMLKKGAENNYLQV